MDVTEQPVESGINISDHVQPKARFMTITGYVVGDDAAEKRAAIIALMNRGPLWNTMGEIISWVLSQA
nr:hypothetical protein [Paenibacillus chinjuensis]